MNRLPLIGFLTAHAVSRTGSRLTLIALPWLVLSTTGSATRTGLVAFVQLGVYVAVSAFGAPLVDRFGRRRVLLSAGLLNGLAVAAVPFLYDRDALPFGTLLGVVAVAGFADGFASLAQRVLLRDVIASSGVSTERAVSVYDGVDRLAGVLGMPLGGVLVVWLGAPHVLWIDAASFAAAVLLLAVTLPRGVAARQDRPEKEPYLAALRGGAAFLRTDRLVLMMCVMLTFTNGAAQALSAVFMPVWISDVIGDPAALGLLAGTFGAGAVAGNVLFTWLAPRMPRFWTFGIAFLLAGSPRFFAMALTDGLTLVIAVSAVSGLATAALNPILSAVMYERIPEPLQARVFGLTSALSWLGIPVGALLGGFAVTGLGVTGALLAGGVVYLAATLMPFAQRIWRDMDRTSTVEPEPEPALASARPAA